MDNNEPILHFLGQNMLRHHMPFPKQNPRHRQQSVGGQLASCAIYPCSGFGRGRKRRCRNTWRCHEHDKTWVLRIQILETFLHVDHTHANKKQEQKDSRGLVTSPPGLCNSMKPYSEDTMMEQIDHTLPNQLHPVSHSLFVDLLNYGPAWSHFQRWSRLAPALKPSSVSWLLDSKISTLTKPK